MLAGKIEQESGRYDFGGLKVTSYGLRVIWLFAKNWTLIINLTIK